MERRSRLSLKAVAALPPAESPAEPLPAAPPAAAAAATLLNLGQSCFLNAVLQAVRSVAGLRGDLERALAEGATRGGVTDSLAALLSAMATAEAERGAPSSAPLSPAVLLQRLRARHSALPAKQPPLFTAEPAVQAPHSTKRAPRPLAASIWLQPSAAQLGTQHRSSLVDTWNSAIDAATNPDRPISPHAHAASGEWSLRLRLSSSPCRKYAFFVGDAG